MCNINQLNENSLVGKKKTQCLSDHGHRQMSVLHAVSHSCSASGWLESQMGNHKKGTTIVYTYNYMDMTKSQGMKNEKSIHLGEEYGKSKEKNDTLNNIVLVFM